MKLSKQHFCPCGRGRAFITTTSKRSLTTWQQELQEAGWTFVDGKAATCNVCNPPKVFDEPTRR